ATHLFANNLAASAAAAERVSAAYLPDEDAALVNTFGHDPLCLALSWAGLTFWALGQPDRAKAAMQLQVERARGLGHPWNLIWSLTGALHPLLFRGEARDMIPLVQEARAVATDQRLDFAEQCICNFHGGLAMVGAGHHAEGLAQLEQGTKLWRTVGGVLRVPHAC